MSAHSPHKMPAQTYALTPTMRDCLWVVQELVDQGVSPTARAIAHELGVAGPGRVHALLWSLRERGFINWQACQRGTLAILRRLPFPPELAADRLDLEILRLPA